MNFNNGEKSFAAALGISDARETELDDQIEKALDEVTKNPDGREWSPAECLATVSVLPQSTEEAFYVGEITGEILQEKKHRGKAMKMLSSLLGGAMNDRRILSANREGAHVAQQSGS